jgi:hypothetical protein
LILLQALDYICDLVELSQPEDQLLRVITLLANIVCSASRLGLLESEDLQNGHDE